MPMHRNGRALRWRYPDKTYSPQSQLWERGPVLTIVMPVHAEPSRFCKRLQQALIAVVIIVLYESIGWPGCAREGTRKSNSAAPTAALMLA